jgi:hypothetical protein
MQRNIKTAMEKNTKKYCRKASLARGELRRLSATKDAIPWNVVAGNTTDKRTRSRGGRFEDDGASESSVEEEQEQQAEDLPVVANREEEEEEQENQDPMVEPPPKEKSIKPVNKRVVIEVDNIDNAIGCLACNQCGDPVKVTIQTVCLASSIGIECTNEDCGFLYHPEPPAGTTIHLERNDNFERSTDYAVNVLYVLSFISMGDGPTEAGRQLGLLGLPNDTTMQSRSFSIIEGRISPIIRELCKDIILNNLKEEAKLSMEASGIHDEHDYKVWKDSLTDKSIKLSIAKMPKLHGSYDMAWQQKGSGHQYNSVSRHGTIVGRRTRKVIALVIKCKVCNQCTAWEKRNPGVEILPHTCYKNHEGSSGSMESAGIVELVTSVFEDHQCWRQHLRPTKGIIY